MTDMRVKNSRSYLTGIEKKRRETRDTAIMDAHSARLNKEAADVLEYQDVWRVRAKSSISN
jgi:hypothetical protein